MEASAEAVDAVGGLVDAVEAAGGVYRTVEDRPQDGYPDASSDHQSARNIVAHVPMRVFFERRRRFWSVKSTNDWQSFCRNFSQNTRCVRRSIILYWDQWLSFSEG